MNNADSILSGCTGGGCGAKFGPGVLGTVLKGLPAFEDERLLVGFDASDDAAVYRLDGGRCMISTVDFFSPMVDDPRVFGRIAAANALSDIYAMGGTPAVALNLVCFPERLPVSVLGEVLEGGAEKIREAGAVVGGGHSIYDRELKYGLAVTGFADTDKVLRNNTPRVGHSVILTKPLGVGIIMAANRAGQASAEAVDKALESMQRLNLYASEKLPGYGVSACTDVTGFGLLAHLLEVCGETASVELDADALPIIPEAYGYADEYLLTAAGQRNREHFADSGDVSRLPFALQELLFDPQTSGGLLVCADAEQADALLRDIKRDDPQAAVIGRIVPRREHAVLFRG